MQPQDDHPKDGLPTDPSTRRDASGSPAETSGSADEPNFSSARADAVFDALKASISKLWDEGASAEDIQSALKKPVP